MKTGLFAAVFGGVAMAVSVTAQPGNLEASSAILSGPLTRANGAFWQTVETNFAGAGRAVFEFSVTNAGKYVILATVDAPGTNANSFWVNMDAEPEEGGMIWEIPVTRGFEQRVVGWKNAPVTGPGNRKSFELQPGKHQVFIRGRHAQTRLARIAILQIPEPPALRIVGSSN